jgi:hypothetical protein
MEDGIISTSTGWCYVTQGRIVDDHMDCRHYLLAILHIFIILEHPTRSSKTSRAKWIAEIEINTACIL